MSRYVVDDDGVLAWLRDTITGACYLKGSCLKGPGATAALEGLGKIWERRGFVTPGLIKYGMEDRV